MRVRVVPHYKALEGIDLEPWIVVVIDVLRASSTIAQALASGARRVVPVAEIREARALCAGYRSGEVLLAGERRGLKIKGFDLGNSPREFTEEVVKGKTVITTTTNGTRALVASQGATEMLVGAFLNLPAVCDYLKSRDAETLLLAVGRDGVPVLDDIVCAGMFTERLLGSRAQADDHVLEDVRAVYQGYSSRLEEAFMDSPSGRDLVAAGLGGDLAYCAQVGLLSVVPRYVNGEITV